MYGYSGAKPSCKRSFFESNHVSRASKPLRMHLSVNTTHRNVEGLVMEEELAQEVRHHALVLGAQPHHLVGPLVASGRLQQHA